MCPAAPNGICTQHYQNYGLPAILRARVVKRLSLSTPNPAFASRRDQEDPFVRRHASLRPTTTFTGVEHHEKKLIGLRQELSGSQKPSSVAQALSAIGSGCSLQRRLALPGLRTASIGSPSLSLFPSLSPSLSLRSLIWHGQKSTEETLYGHQLVRSTSLSGNEARQRS